MPPNNTTTAHPPYRADIDGLRAIAVLSVVFFHAFPHTLTGGFIGVDIFFVISGYLISTILFGGLDRQTFRFSDFYARRVKRIFPALFLVLISSYAFGWFALLPEEYEQLGKHMAAGSGFISNFILWGESGYFDNAAETKPLLHLWSLGIEEQFYIVWPLLLWLAWKRQFGFLSMIISLFFISFILNMKGIREDTVSTFYSPQTRFWELLAGSFLGWLFFYKREQIESFKININHLFETRLYTRKILPGRDIFSNVLSFFGISILLWGFIVMNKGFFFPGKWAIIPVVGAALIIAAGPQAFINRIVLSNKLLVWIGLISFPLYLWHWPLLSFPRIMASGTPDLSVRVGAVVVSILLAWMTYRFIERPVRFGGHDRLKTMVLICLMTVVGLTGYATYTQEGYPWRSAVNGIVDNTDAFARAVPVNKECLDYIGTQNPIFPYCRLTPSDAFETVAVVGDSHAHVAYPGIAEAYRDQGKKTVLLANSSCPPLLGVPIFGRTDADRKLCESRVQQLVDTLKSKTDIKKVFLFMRGPIYFTGTEPITDTADVLNSRSVSIEDYKSGIQRTVDHLVDSGKEVFLVTENPELEYPVTSCVPRPLRDDVADCRPSRKQVQERQKAYLQMVNTLQNVTVINSLSAFCPNEKCTIFHQGKLLYMDDDHLSTAGSFFQVDKLLRPYLN